MEMIQELYASFSNADNFKVQYLLPITLAIALGLFIPVVYTLKCELNELRCKLQDEINRHTVIEKTQDDFIERLNEKMEEIGDQCDGHADEIKKQSVLNESYIVELEDMAGKTDKISKRCDKHELSLDKINTIVQNIWNQPVQFATDNYHNDTVGVAHQSLPYLSECFSLTIDNFKSNPCIILESDTSKAIILTSNNWLDGNKCMSRYCNPVPNLNQVFVRDAGLCYKCMFYILPLDINQFPNINTLNITTKYFNNFNMSVNEFSQKQKEYVFAIRSYPKHYRSSINSMFDGVDKFNGVSFSLKSPYQMQSVKTITFNFDPEYLPYNIWFPFDMFPNCTNVHTNLPEFNIINMEHNTNHIVFH